MLIGLITTHLQDSSTIKNLRNRTSKNQYDDSCISERIFLKEGSRKLLERIEAFSDYFQEIGTLGQVNLYTFL